MHKINALKEVLTFIQGELKGDSKKKAMAEGLSNFGTITKCCSGNGLRRDRKESKMAAILNPDSENSGTTNSSFRKSGGGVCHGHACACVSAHVCS